MLTDAQLLYLNQIGIIPGPKEEEAAFLLRSDECLHLAEVLVEEGGGKGDELAMPESLQPSLAVARELFDMAPDWVPLFFSNRGLSLWHGGCAWICQLSEQSQTVAFLQLRRVFAHQERYLGIYDRKELLAHELAHVGRMTFQEPQFEEILAYRTAHSRFRRWFGPLVMSTREAMAFLVILCLLLVVDLAVLAQPTVEGLNIALGFALIPLLMLGYAVCRLARRQWRFARCLKRLRRLFSHVSHADAVIYRLTDEEILHFSRLTPREILDYAQQAGGTSLRWRLLLLAYF